MCSPMAVVAGVSIGASMYGSYEQQKTDNEIADYNAATLRENAKTAKFKGEYAQKAAREEAAKVGIRTSQFVGKQRAIQAATGAVVDHGTFLDLELDAEAHGQMEEMSILHGADVQAWQAEMEALGLGAQAQFIQGQKINPWVTSSMAGFQTASHWGPSVYDAGMPKGKPKSTALGTGVAGAGAIGSGAMGYR